MHYTLGVIYFRYADENKLAEQHLKLAVKFCPEYADSYALLVDVLKQDERHDETIEICKSGLKAERADKSALLGSLGNAWELKQNYGKAIKSYRKALRHSAELWNCRVLEENIKRCKRKQK